MKRSRGILGILLIGVLGAAGCGGGSPTSSPPNGGVSAELDLSGAWNGTVNDRAGACGSEPFMVSLTQSVENAHGFNGPKVTGSFSTPCQGQFELQLYLNINHVVGTVVGKGYVDGVASESAVDFSIIHGHGGLEGGQTVTTDIALRK